MCGEDLVVGQDNLRGLSSHEYYYTLGVSSVSFFFSVGKYSTVEEEYCLFAAFFVAGSGFG